MFSGKIPVSDLSGESLEKIFDLVNDTVTRVGRLQLIETKEEILLQLYKTAEHLQNNQAQAHQATLGTLHGTSTAIADAISGLSGAVDRINQKISNTKKSELRSPTFSSSSGVFTALYSSGLVDDDEVSQETQILGEISLLVFDLQIARVVSESLKVALANYYPTQIDLCQTLESAFLCIANVRFNHEMCHQFGVRLCEFCCCYRNIVLKNRTTIDISTNISEFHALVKRSLELCGKLCNRGWLSLMIKAQDGMTEFQSIDHEVSALVEGMEATLNQGRFGLSSSRQYVRYSIDVQELHKHIKVLGGLKSIMKSTRKLQQMAGLIRIDSDELKHELCRYFEIIISSAFVAGSTQGNWIQNQIHHYSMEIFWQKCIGDKEFVKKREFISLLTEYLVADLNLNETEASSLTASIIESKREDNDDDEIMTAAMLRLMTKDAPSDCLQTAAFICDKINNTTTLTVESTSKPVAVGDVKGGSSSWMIGRDQDLIQLQDLLLHSNHPHQQQVDLAACIVIHGIQGVGKSALVSQLLRQLQGTSKHERSISCLYQSASHVHSDSEAMTMLLSSLIACDIESSALNLNDTIKHRLRGLGKSMSASNGMLVCCIDDVSLDNVKHVLKLIHEVRTMFFAADENDNDDNEAFQCFRSILICRDAAVVSIIQKRTDLNPILYQVSPLTQSSALEFVERNFPRQAMKLAQDLCESFEYLPLPLELASRLPLASMYDVIISTKTRSLVGGGGSSSSSLLSSSSPSSDGLEGIASSVQFSNSLYTSLPRRAKTIMIALCRFPHFFDKESSLLVAQFCLMSLTRSNSRRMDDAVDVQDGVATAAQDVEFAVMAVECGAHINERLSGSVIETDDDDTKKLKTWKSLAAVAESIVNVLISSKMIQQHYDLSENVLTIDPAIKSLILDQVAGVMRDSRTVDYMLHDVALHAFIASVLSKMRLISRLAGGNKPIMAMYHFDRNRANIDTLFRHSVINIPKLLLAQCIDVFLELTKIFQVRVSIDILCQLHAKLIELADAAYLSQQTFKLWSNLSTIYASKKDYASAYRAAEKSLDQAKSEKGPTSIDLVPLYDCLGKAAEGAGDVKRAIEVYTAALHVLKMNRSTVKAADVLLKKFGKQKHDKELDLTFVTMNRKLGEAYFQDGKYEQALEYCNRSIEEFESKYNFMSPLSDAPSASILRVTPDFLSSLTISANVNSKFRDFEASERCLAKACKVSSKLSNQSNDAICELRVRHCEALANIGRSAECIPVLNECLKELSRLNSSSLIIDKVLDMLAEVSITVGQLQQAKQFSVTLLTMREATFGPNSAETCAALSRYGKLLIMTQDYARAIPMFEKLSELTSLLLGANHRQISDVLLLLAEAFVGTGRNEEGVVACQRSLRILSATDYNEMEHADIKKLEIEKSNILFVLAEAQLKSKMLAESLQSLLTCEKIREKHLGDYHGSVADVAFKIGSILQRQGRLQESIAYYDKAKQIQELLTNVPST